MLHRSLLAPLATLALLAAPRLAPAQTAPLATAVFYCTYAPQTYTVPAGIYSITVDAWGASGDGSADNFTGSYVHAGGGAHVQATLAVTPGQVLTLFVGGKPDWFSEMVTANDAYGNAMYYCPGGYNGGGTGYFNGQVMAGSGGGASDVRVGAATLADRVLVAGGGGGAPLDWRYLSGTSITVYPGGGGGTPDGQDGHALSPQYYFITNIAGPNGGKGATQTSGYALGQGESARGFVVNRADYYLQAGGGGGYYGGYASAVWDTDFACSGGGGGSSWVTPTGSSNVQMTAGVSVRGGQISITPNAQPLPVELTAFTAVAQGPAAVRLAWVTASEQNSARFEVERSPDGTTFAPIGTVPAAGQSTTPQAYALRDQALPAGVPKLYYRLRQVDRDGSFTYSAVRAVARPDAPAALAVYPNPARSSATLTGAAPGTPVRVVDALGRPVATATADATGTAALRLPPGLPRGVYMVRTGGQALRLAVD